MADRPGIKSGRRWKLERASVHRTGLKRPHSNKYAKTTDKSKRTPPGERERVWVGRYVRSDGVVVREHYRRI